MGIDAHHMQLHTQASAHGLTMLFKIASRGLQPMVDMHRQHLSRPARRAGPQKCTGVGAAAVGDSERQARFKGRNRRIQRTGHGLATVYLPLALVSV
jgi:hypothetical protein